MAKSTKLNESKLDAISSYADKLGRMYEDLSKMPNRIRKIAIGLSLDSSPESNRNINLGSGVSYANTIPDSIEKSLSDDEYFAKLEKLVDSKCDCVKLNACRALIESLDADINAKRRMINKLEERIYLSEDKSNAEINVVKNRIDVFKNNLVISEGRKIRILEYYFKLRHALIKTIEGTADGIAQCLMSGDKYTEELSKRYPIKKLLDRIGKFECVFDRTKEER